MHRNVLVLTALAGGLLFAGATIPALAAHNGGGNSKVTVCHNGHTITIAAPALPAHLSHGDAAGPCGGATPTETAAATATGTAEITPTGTLTPTPTGTPEAVSTDTPTATPTDTPTETPTDTPTETPTETPIAALTTDENGSVAVCHNERTIYVIQQAVAAHIGHGDALGPC